MCKYEDYDDYRRRSLRESNTPNPFRPSARPPRPVEAHGEHTWTNMLVADNEQVRGR